jgi:hypothetical protein
MNISYICCHSGKLATDCHVATEKRIPVSRVACVSREGGMEGEQKGAETMTFHSGSFPVTPSSVNSDTIW